MQNPGLLYVAATLLPLASFVLLLAAGAIRAAARPYPHPTTYWIFSSSGAVIGPRLPSLPKTSATLAGETGGKAYVNQNEIIAPVHLRLQFDWRNLVLAADADFFMRGDAAKFIVIN